MTEQEYKRKDQGTSCINNKVHLMIDDLLMTQNVGENQGKWVSAIKEAISMDEKEKLIQLRSMFPYSFENSLKHLKKEEREFIKSGVRR